MVSKRWQRTERLVAHGSLAAVAALPLFLFELPYDTAVKWALTLAGYLILIPLFRWLHRKYATTFVKVFRCDHEVATRIIQRALNAQRLPFTKLRGDDQYVFQIRPGKMQLTVDAYVLNLMIDDHLKPETATKLTLKPETTENAEQMGRLRQSLDEAFAVQGW